MAVVVVDKPSFSSGQIAYSLTSNTRGKPYLHGSFDISNGYITKQGSLRKRNGLKLRGELGYEHVEGKATRMFPFKDSYGREYIFVAVEGQNGLRRYLVNEDGTLTGVNYWNQYNLNNVNVPKTNVANRFTKDMIENMQSAVSENIICFTHNSFAPFFIISDERGLIYVDSLGSLSLYFNSNNRNLLNFVDSEVYFKRIFQSYPFEFYEPNFLITALTSNHAFTAVNGIHPAIPAFSPGGAVVGYYSFIRIFSFNRIKTNPFNKLMVAQDLGTKTETVDGKETTVANFATPHYNYMYVFPNKVPPSRNVASLNIPFINTQRTVFNIDATFYRFQNESISDTNPFRFPDTSDAQTDSIWYGITSTEFRPRANPKTSLYISEWEEGDYPRTCAFFENRLVLGGTRKSPQKVWFSEVNAPSKFFDFDTYQAGTKPVTAVSPGAFSISDNQEFEIKRMFSQDSLFIATDESFFSTRGTDPSSSVPFSHGFINNFRQPASSQPMASTDNYVYFLSANQKNLYRIVFSREFQKYRTEDMSVLFGDFEKPLKLVGFDQESSVSLFIRGDDEILFFTDEKQSETMGWSRAVLPHGLKIIDSRHRVKQSGEVVFSFLLHNSLQTKLQFFELSFDNENEFSLDYEEVLDKVEGATVQEYKKAINDMLDALNTKYRSFPIIVANNNFYPSARDLPDDVERVHLGYPVRLAFSPTIPAISTQEGSTRSQSQNYKKMYFNIVEGGQFTVLNKHGKIKTFELYNYSDTGVTTAKKIVEELFTPITRDHDNRMTVQVNDPYHFEIAGISFEGEVNT